MDFLLVGILMVWSLGSCFFPMKETGLRSLMMTNAIIVAMALCALAVSAMNSAEPITALRGLLVADKLRGLLLVPMAISWITGVAAFAKWWGGECKSSVGTRPLFCLRSATLVAAFMGILLILLTDSLPVMLGGLLLTSLMACIGMLFHVHEEVLPHARKFTLGFAGMFVMLTAGIGLMLGGGGRFAMVGLVCTGFSALCFMGLLPGLTWYRKGMMHLPKGQRLMMRVLLPAALFPHVLTLAAGGATGIFMQKMLLILSIFSGLTLIEYLRAKEGVSETSGVLLLTSVLVSLAYGAAGAIPALMLVMMLVLWGTLALIAQGGTWWKLPAKRYAVLVLVGVPFVSPLFVPYVLSLGYGIQMMPAVACVFAVLLVYATYALAVRVYRAWNEDTVSPADVWRGRLATVLLGIMTVYGCWFMYADALSQIVDAVGG
jgi:hypothetical protein